jgi:hypothetical protein
MLGGITMITIYQVNSRYYIATSNGLQEIHPGIVDAWNQEGAELDIRVGEDYV